MVFIWGYCVMIVATHGVMQKAASGASYNAYVQAWIDKLTALGITAPSATVLTALSTMCDSIGNTILAKMDAIYLSAQDGSSQAATINLLSPNDTAASLVNSPTWTSNQGHTGNGTSSYIDFNIVPDGTKNFKQDSAIFGSVTRSFGSSGRNASVLNANGIPLWFRFDDSRLYVNSSGFIPGVSLPAAKSRVCGLRPDSGSQDYYLNGTFVSNDTDTSAALSTASMRVLRQGTTYSNAQTSINFWGGKLTSGEISTVDTAFATYLGGLTGW